jgi:ribonucleotide monophosphatase NagD (HAD superfamily)
MDAQARRRKKNGIFGNFSVRHPSHSQFFSGQSRHATGAAGEGEQLRKPSEEFSRLALETIGVGGADCAMVGDTKTDLQAASSGKFAECFLLTSGMRSANELISFGAKAERIFPDLISPGKSAFGLSWD